ncbi:MAG: TonB-dependent receptor plug domain-containing protein, partial [Rhodoferax sp.]|nr:TonB-dependent receptor plug domain-containing protein [Rhodoferax sp.]
MKKFLWLARSGASVLAGLVGLMFSQGLVAQTLGVSEKDFLEEMPIILSVSRLPQRLDETPGAVTILDRDFIRSSGARDVADLLRLVPGFQSSTSFEGDAPQAS